MATKRNDEMDLDAKMAKDGWERVENVAKAPRAAFSIRLSSEEFEAFNGAAKARRMTLSDFLRSAAWAAVDGTSDPNRTAVVADVREKARQLAAAASKLRA